MHDGNHIGAVCEECGTHHRVIESLGKQPLTRSELESLEETELFTFAKGIQWWFGEMSSAADGEETTEDIVLANHEIVMLLSLREPGWVVEFEWEPEEDESVEEVAEEVWMDHSAMLSQAVEEAL